MPDPRGLEPGTRGSEHVWLLRSGTINEVVRAADQFAAWRTLSERPVEDFGLILTAERDEDDDPIAARTSALMFAWGRDEDARTFVAAAIAAGLPDTTEADLLFAAGNREIPEPREGLVVFDPASPLDRWVIKGVAADDRIDAKRIDPADGKRHSWDRAGWDRAWQNGWLKEAING